MNTKLTIWVMDYDATTDFGGKLPPYIEAQYNPSELTLQKGAQIAEQNIPGLDSPLLQFIRGQTQKLSVELTLDDGSLPAGSSLSSLLESLYQLVKVQPKTHAAPRVDVDWGMEFSFTGITESVQRKLTLFDRDGTPIRAIVSLTFREYRTLDEQLSELNLQSSDHTKVTVVTGGDRLDMIAFREYGDAAFWPQLARFNRIEDVRRIIPGTMLELPPLDELRKATAGV